MMAFFSKDNMGVGVEWLGLFPKLMDGVFG